MTNFEQSAPADMKNKWLALTFLALSVSIVVMDGTIINVAIPVIMRDLSLTFTQIEWVTTIYALIFSALLITTGRIADHVGRRKMLIIGMSIFTIGSILASMSRGIELLLIARCVQGIGGATVLPTTLSAVNSTFFGRDRMIAFAVWGSVISGMAALGPLLGGYLITYFTWEWIFWINVPIGLVILAGTLAFVPKTYGEKMLNGFDFPGFILSSVGLASLVFVLIEGRGYGWVKAKEASHALLGISVISWLAVVAVISLALFIFVEKRRMSQGKSVLLDMDLFKIKSFSAGNLVACIVAVGEFGLLFVLPLFLQNILDLTPLQAGIILATMGLGAFISGGLASEIARRTYPTFVARIGLLLESLGMLGFFFTVTPGVSLNVIAAWLVVYGLGLGMASAQITSTVLIDVPGPKSGQGSATQSTVRQVGSVLGVALIGTILASFISVNVTHNLEDQGLPEQALTGIVESIEQSAGGSIGAIKENPEYLGALPPEMQHSIVEHIEAGFTESAAKTIGVAGGIVFLGFLVTFLLPKKKKAASAQAQTDAPAAQTSNSKA